jgi:hypothetical protein
MKTKILYINGAIAVSYGGLTENKKHKNFALH